MTGAETRAVVAVKILVEQQQIAPVRIVLELPRPAVDGPVAVPQRRHGMCALRASASRSNSTPFRCAVLVIRTSSLRVRMVIGNGGLQGGLQSSEPGGRRSPASRRRRVE